MARVTVANNSNILIDNGKALKTYVGGDKTFTFTITMDAKSDDIRTLYEYFFNWINQPINLEFGLWKGFVAELTINYGSFIYRRSLLDGFANKVRVEYSTGLYTAWAENKASQDLYGVRTHTERAIFLTLAGGESYRDDLLKEMVAISPQIIGRVTETDVITLEVTAVGNFFKCNWVPVPTYGSYANDVNLVLAFVFADIFADYNHYIEPNSVQVVGPPSIGDNANNLEFMSELVTHTPDAPYKRYRIYMRDDVIIASYDEFNNDKYLSNGEIVYDSLLEIQPGFYKDHSIPLSGNIYYYKQFTNLIFVESIEFNITEDGIVPSISTEDDIQNSDIWHMYWNLQRQMYIDNREEEKVLTDAKAAEAKRKREREKQESEK